MNVMPVKIFLKSEGYSRCSSPAFAPNDAIISYLRVAFFVSISVQIRPYPSVIQREFIFL